jgi:hypothetical protein
MNITFEDVWNMPHKVYIAQPSGDAPRYHEFQAAMDQLWRPMHTIKPEPARGLYPANQQNHLAREFLKTDADWFWLVNDDQIYDPRTLARLLGHDKDVVIPLCLEKNPPHRPLIYDAPGKDGLHAYRYLRKGDKGLQRVYSSGGGGLLVKRRVFEAIDDPWWDQRMVKNEQGLSQLMSEDMPFCEKVNAAGFEIWCDFDWSAIHLGTWGVRPKRDAKTGEWYTEVLRGGGSYLAPAAKHPSGIEAPDRRIVVPDFRRAQ